MTFGALGGDPRSAHDVQAEKSRVGLPNTEEISAKSPEARNGCGETSRSAAYAKRPRASVPAVRGPPNRPVGPASSNTGIQKCGRSDGHMVYPVSEIGTAGAESNGSGFANVTGAAPSRADTRRSSQPRALSAAYRSVPSASGAGARAPSGSFVSGCAPPPRPPSESRQRYACGTPVGSATNQSSPPDVHTTSAMLPPVSSSTTAASGESTGQRTSAQ